MKETAQPEPLDSSAPSEGNAIGRFANSAVNNIKEFLKGGAIGINELRATTAKLADLITPDLNKDEAEIAKRYGYDMDIPQEKSYLSQIQERIDKQKEDIESPIASLIGQVVLDPLNVLPAGLVAKGAKGAARLANTAKSAAGGALIAGGSTAAHVAGDDETDTLDKIKQVGLGALIGAGLNAGLYNVLSRKGINVVNAVEELKTLGKSDKEIVESLTAKLDDILPNQPKVADEVVINAVDDITPTPKVLDDGVSYSAQIADQLKKPYSAQVADQLKKPVDEALDVETLISKIPDDVLLKADDELKLSVLTDDIINSGDKNLMDIFGKVMSGANKTYDPKMANILMTRIKRVDTAVANEVEYRSAKPQILDDIKEFDAVLQEKALLDAEYEDVMSRLERKQFKEDKMKELAARNRILDEQGKRFNSYGFTPNLGTGIAGGIGGAGKEVYEANEEGRRMTIQSLIENVASGAALGAGSGFIVKSVTPKIAAQPKIEMNKIAKLFDKIKDNKFIDLSFATKLKKQKDYLAYGEQYRNQVLKNSDKIMLVNKALNKLPIEIRKDLHSALTLRSVDVAPEVQKLADKFRNNINYLVDEQVRLGVLSKEAAEEWKDVYLHRSYEPTKDLAKLFGRSKSVEKIYMRGAKQNVTQKEYDELVANGLIGRVSDGKFQKIGEKGNKIVVRRDYTPEERKKMGEITDGAYTITDTLFRLNKRVDNANFLDVISKHTGISSKEEKIGYKQMNGEKWGALNKQYVPEEIANDLQNLNRRYFGVDNELESLWMKYMSYFKQSKTVFNPVSHVNNVVSNIALLAGEGVPINNMIYKFPHTLSTIGKMDKINDILAKEIINTATPADIAAKAKMMQDPMIMSALEGKELGLFGESRLADVMVGEQNQLIEKGILKQTVRAMQDAYKLEDWGGRLYYFDYLRKSGKTPEEAIKIVNKLIADYSTPMSVFATRARDYGIIPFVSWTYHVFPNVLRQLSPVSIDINKSGLSKYSLAKTDSGQGIEKYRATNLLKFIGIYAFMETALGIDFGLMSYFDKDRPESFAGKRIKLKETGNKITTLKVDRWIPQLEGIEFIKDLATMPIAGLPGKIKQDLGGGLYPKLVSALSNVDLYTGQPITREKGVKGNVESAAWLANQFLIPPAITNTAKLLKDVVAQEPEKQKKGSFIIPRTIPEKVLGLLGINVLSYDDKKFKALEEAKNK